MTRFGSLKSMVSCTRRNSSASISLIYGKSFFALILSVLVAQALIGGAFASARGSRGDAEASFDPEPSSAEIIQGIDNAVRNREKVVAGYTVKDHYAIYRNGGATPAAEMTVQTVYTKGVGKSFTTLSESGSGLLRSTVIEKIIAGEKEMSTADVRDSVLVNSTNYEMTPDLTRTQLNGKDCYLVALKARRKSPHLFNGKAWVDASDFSVLRLEGTPSQSPSFFAGDSTMARDYSKFDGIPMAVRAEAHSHNFLLGDTTLKIESTDYQIQRNP